MRSTILIPATALALAMPGAPAEAPQAAVSAVQPATCLPERGRVEPPRIGPLRLGRTRATLRRRAAVTPESRRPYSLRWCAEGAPGSLTAVFSSKRPEGTARLIVTTAPGYRIAGVGPGHRLRAFRRRFPRTRHLGGRLYRAAPGSTLFFVVGRDGRRVRYVGAATRRVLDSRALRERYLRRAG